LVANLAIVLVPSTGLDCNFMQSGDEFFAGLIPTAKNFVVGLGLVATTESIKVLARLWLQKLGKLSATATCLLCSSPRRALPVLPGW